MGTSKKRETRKKCVECGEFFDYYRNQNMTRCIKCTGDIRKLSAAQVTQRKREDQKIMKILNQMEENPNIKMKVLQHFRFFKKSPVYTDGKFDPEKAQKLIDEERKIQDVKHEYQVDYNNATKGF